MANPAGPAASPTRTRNESPDKQSSHPQELHAPQLPLKPHAHLQQQAPSLDPPQLQQANQAQRPQPRAQQQQPQQSLPLQPLPQVVTPQAMQRHHAQLIKHFAYKSQALQQGHQPSPLRRPPVAHAPLASLSTPRKQTLITAMFSYTRDQSPRQSPTVCRPVSQQRGSVPRPVAQQSGGAQSVRVPPGFYEQPQQAGPLCMPPPTPRAKSSIRSRSEEARRPPSRGPGVAAPRRSCRVTAAMCGYGDQTQKMMGLSHAMPVGVASNPASGTSPRNGCE